MPKRKAVIRETRHKMKDACVLKTDGRCVLKYGMHILLLPNDIFLEYKFRFKIQSPYCHCPGIIGFLYVVKLLKLF